MRWAGAGAGAQLQPPAGYVTMRDTRAIVVARADVAQAMRAALDAAPPDDRTLYGFARNRPEARAFTGRQAAYGVDLPGTAFRMVVRHNRHGGALRRLTGDLFLRPTRAPLELEIALRLASLDVPTTTMLGYAIYAAGGPFARSDVVTEEIAESGDLRERLVETRNDPVRRKAVIAATLELLDKLARAGVRHHDLNARNVLLREQRNEIPPFARDGGDRLDPDDGATFAAYVLDVDRVQFGVDRASAQRENEARLVRSIAKLRRVEGLDIGPEELLSGARAR